MPASSFGTLLGGSRLVPVLALDDAEDALPLADALEAGGISCVEVTFRTPVAAEAIEALSQRSKFLVGAGTVVTEQQVDRAIAAGAHFVVSPGLDPAIVSRCQGRGVPVLPGIATATELQRAFRLGLDVVKFFPAEAIGGARTIRALSAPFANMRFVPTGGIGPHNLADYLALSSVLAVGGSWMVAPELVRSSDWDTVADYTRQAVGLAGTVAPA